MLLLKNDYDGPLYPELFEEGTTILVDKPLHWTSFDAVNKIKAKLKFGLGLPKIKIGHAGTLDPMATGLLIICTGKNTKMIDQYQGMEKQYTGTFYLGATRPSYDLETEIDAYFPIEHIDEARITAAILPFKGDIAQLPPIFSAIKMDGQPIYKKARKGREVLVEPRNVHISNFEITHNRLPELDFAVTCSKGTYIRSLAYDFGLELDSGAYLAALCRTQIGQFKNADAWNLDALIAKLHLAEQQLKVV